MGALPSFQQKHVGSTMAAFPGGLRFHMKSVDMSLRAATGPLSDFMEMTGN